jgi:hypothetical protein
MASILDRYGIKEVADVTFYDINEDGTRGNPVLYLDTLKVSTIEQTAETSDARGGKGNPKLITWDYGKDITVTLEDALFSAKSLSIMFGNGTVNAGPDNITKTVMARLGEGATITTITIDVYDPAAQKTVRKPVNYTDLGNYNVTGIKVFNEKSAPVTVTTAGVCTGEGMEKGARVFVTYTIPVNKKEIIVSADSFPGTYYITGDTYARSDVTGDDQFFQFIIEKAKVTSENTITLEAEGDPSVFNMNLTVLRPESGDMMKLVQYDLLEERIINIYGPKVLKKGASGAYTTDYEGVTADSLEWNTVGDQGDVTFTKTIDPDTKLCGATIKAGDTAGAVKVTATAQSGAIVGSFIIDIQ